jgi:hypothetical protein
MKSLIESSEYRKADKAGDWVKTSNMAAEVSMKFDAPMSAREANLQKKTIGDIEGSMVGMINQTAELKIISDTFLKEFLTLPGKLKFKAFDWTLKGGEWAEELVGLSPKDRTYVIQFGQFVGANMRLINKYINEISGAQFSVKEMERYEKSLMNITQNYEVYIAEYNNFVNFVKRGYRIRSLVLQQGLTGKAMQDEIDRLVKLGYDPTLDPDNIKKRGDYWKSKGLSMPEINKKLVQEGYFLK